jgi:hypothetical protein
VAGVKAAEAACGEHIICPLVEASDRSAFPARRETA